jgi:hypothetical protein
LPIKLVAIPNKCTLIPLLFPVLTLTSYSLEASCWSLWKFLEYS